MAFRGELLKAINCTVRSNEKKTVIHKLTWSLLIRSMWGRLSSSSTAWLCMSLDCFTIFVSASLICRCRMFILFSCYCTSCWLSCEGGWLGILGVLSLSPVCRWINTRWGWLSLSSFRGRRNEYQCTGPGVCPGSNRCTISLCVVKGDHSWRQEGHPAIKHCLKKGTMVAWSPQKANPCSAGKNGCKKTVFFCFF